MSQTFVFEELDAATRDYLTAVRESEGSGTPGFFARTSSSLGGCGCISGLIIIPFTLLATLTNMFNVVYEEPLRVAMLQTAGLLLGGWLLFAFFRAKSKGNSKTAGYWVYVDPLHLYVAYREQVTVTRIDDALEAVFTHNYNNGAYQNSVVHILLSGGGSTSFTITNENRAEQIRVYVNYLAWARGPDGGGRAGLPAATLGGLAKYVAKNDVEPKDADNNINLDMIELDVTEVPEEPTREGRAIPAFMPYLVMIFAGIGIFCLMGYVVNPPYRDDAIFEAISKQPTTPNSEPQYLRLYLADPRNEKHREAVKGLLKNHYGGAINLVTNNATDPELKEGMLKILKSLSTTEQQPFVSLKITETSPDKLASGKAAREKKFRDALVGGGGSGGSGPRDGILDEFARVSPAVKPQDTGATISPPPVPIGHQLIAFVVPPEDAKNAHFEIGYEFKPLAVGNAYSVSVTVVIREQVDGPPIANVTKDLPAAYVESDLDSKAIDDLKDNVVRWMVGKQAQAGAVIGGGPGGPGGFGIPVPKGFP